ncbi:ABC transporter permease [Paenibacillus sp. PK4536]|uniref:ABC transporter permease n=1 Tax=unclassified Paenibacillus TaxID=185978 RepID=UPI0010C019F2|nr:MULTISPECIES: ABC transporter permease [unclassified Paenibacillus]TKJ93426.1 ABC transporter permease [Paenibacillus sp. CFBP13512]WIM41264.1 ABC transporter permease [Paenibacillus sp. PK4536]
MTRLKRNLFALLQPIIAVIIGLLAGAIAIVLLGDSVIDTYAEMWNGAFGSFYFLTNTLTRATPIILTGLGVALAFRAGFFNMGSTGQMVLGGLAAAITALYLPGPGWMVLVVSLVVGMAIGGLWSLFAGYMDAKFGINLLISTLLLNYIASLFAGYMVAFPLKDQSGSAAMAQTPMIDKSVWLPKLFSGMSLHAGFILAIVAAIALYIFIQKSVSGYEIRMLGNNPFFAAYGGVKRGRMMVVAMLTSGALAGLAGAGEVLGTQHRYLDGALASADYGWSGIMATLLASSNPLGTAVAGILLAALQTGAMGVERNTNVPLEVASVIQAVLTLFVSARFGYAFLKRRKEKK